MSVLHNFRLWFHWYFIYHSCNINVSLSSQMIKPTVYIIRNIDIHESRTIKSLLARSVKRLRNFFAIKRTVRCDLWFQENVLPSYQIKYNAKKKKIFDLKIQDQDQFYGSLPRYFHQEVQNLPVLAKDILFFALQHINATKMMTNQSKRVIRC